MSQLIFLDVDGTLVNYENHLPDSAIAAIRAARKNGHRVYLSTGRSRAEIYPELWAIGVDGLIGGNGSYVEDDQQVLMHQSLTLEQCQRAMDWLNTHDLPFYLESNAGLFASRDFETRAVPAIREYSQRKGKENAQTLTTRQVFPEMIFGEEAARADVNKISYLLGQYTDFLDTKAAFPDLKSGTWGGVGEIALFGDLGVKDISKAHAIDVLLAHRNHARENTIAFGDASIDIPMLEYCACGVAMGNGGEGIKAMADYITDSVDDNGLYNAFVHFGLIEKGV